MTMWSMPVSMVSPRKCRRDLVQKALKLAPLVPRREPEGDVPHAGLEVGPELLGTLPRAAGDRPALDERGAEVRRVVGVEELLRLLERGLPILVDVDVVIQRAADAVGVTPLVARHHGDARPLAAKLVGRELVGHPAVGVPGHAPVGALDGGVAGTAAALPREAGRVAGDPDGVRLLDGTGLERDRLERVIASVEGHPCLLEQLAENDHALLEASHALLGAHAHRRMLEGLRL